jgi:hypothetical protein
MTERRVSVRLTATGGQQVKAELQGIGQAGATSLQRTSVEVDRLNRSFGAMGGSGGGLRSAALQLSQVGQQAMATGNFVQALSIQLPDLLLGFGTFGIAAGVAAGALLPLIANMVNVGGQATTLEDSLGRARDAVGELEAATKNFTGEGLEQVRERYGAITAEIEKLLQRQAQFARNNAEDAARAVADSVRGELGGFFGRETTGIADLLGVERSVRQVDNFGNAIRTINPLVREFQEGLAALEGAGGFQAQADAAARLLTLLEENGAAGSELFGQIFQAESELRAAAARAAELDTLMGQATDAAGRFASTDLASGVAAAADQAARLRRLLDQQRADNAVVFDPRDPRFNADRAAFARQQEAFRREQELAERTSVPRVARSGGGGGGGRAAAPDPLGGMDPEFLSQVAASVSGVTSEVSALGETTKALSSAAGDAFVSFVTGAESARDALKGLLSDFGRVLAQQAFQGFGTALKLPGFANGTNFAPGGLAVVGERGPEIVNLPRGSQVYSNEVSRRMGGQAIFQIDARGAERGSADEIVAAIEARVLPKLRNYSVASVRDVARRGG